MGVGVLSLHTRRPADPGLKVEMPGSLQVCPASSETTTARLGGINAYDGDPWYPSRVRSRRSRLQVVLRTSDSVCFLVVKEAHGLEVAFAANEIVAFRSDGESPRYPNHIFQVAGWWHGEVAAEELSSLEREAVATLRGLPVDKQQIALRLLRALMEAET